jgi:hypothetical protein
MSWIQNELARQEQERTALRELQMLCALLIERAGGSVTFSKDELGKRMFDEVPRIDVQTNELSDSVTYRVWMDDSRTVEE